MTCDTKEKIIDAAFSFYNWINLDKISLQMIAERVGITKAAIYKHFKSKEELDEIMKDRIYSDFFNVLKDADHYSDNSNVLEQVVTMLLTKSQYLYYLISNTFDFNFDDFVINLQKKGIYILDSIFSETGEVLNWDRYKNIVFTAGTLLFFQCVFTQNRCISKTENEAEDIKIYAHKLADLIKKCTNPDRSETGVFRLAEIDDICRKKVKSLPESDVTLKAVANVVSRAGFQGITVDAIAKELGIAKSSLYSKFEDKNQMILKIQDKMLKTMLELTKENMNHAQTPQEGIYILMESEAECFIRYKEILIVCKWLQFQNHITELEPVREKHKKYREYYSYLLNCDIVKKIPDLGVPGIDSSVVIGWYFAMTIFLCIHADRHDFSDEMIHAALKDIFYMLAEGQREDY